MKLRYCDHCQKQINNNIFIKCCESYIAVNKKKLNHIGDLCVNCADEIFKNYKEVKR